MSAARAKTEDSVNNDALTRPVLLRGTRVGCGMAGCAMSVPVPDFFTLPEVGRILRIGRNSAYKAATEYERTGGVSGLPFVKVGKLKRVSSVVVEKLKGGPITWPLPHDDETGRAKKSKSRAAQPDDASTNSPASGRAADGIIPPKRSKKAAAPTPAPVVANDERGERPTSAAASAEGISTAERMSGPADAQSRPAKRSRRPKESATQSPDGLDESTTPKPVRSSTDQQLALGF